MTIHHVSGTTSVRLAEFTASDSKQTQNEASNVKQARKTRKAQLTPTQITYQVTRILIATYILVIFHEHMHQV